MNGNNKAFKKSYFSVIGLTTTIDYLKKDFHSLRKSF